MNGSGEAVGGLVKSRVDGYPRLKTGYAFGVNCNTKTTCTNSSGVKPDLGLDQDQLENG